MAKPILYSYFRSSASFRVRIALAHKGIEYEYRAVSLGKDADQFKEEYQKLNPMRQVPTLVINGVTLTQSLPIIEYLDEVHPEKPLLPKDPVLRAQVRRIAEIVNSGIQPLQNLDTLKKISELAGEEARLSWAQHFIKIGFEGLEKVLTETSGKFCVGDDVTLADLALYPQVFNAARFNLDVTPYPTIRAIFNRCDTMGAFQLAHPSKQPDFSADGGDILLQKQ